MILHFPSKSTLSCFASRRPKAPLGDLHQQRCPLPTGDQERDGAFLPSTTPWPHPRLAVSVSLSGHGACPAAFSIRSTHVRLQEPRLSPGPLRWAGVAAGPWGPAPLVGHRTMTEPQTSHTFPRLLPAMPSAFCQEPAASARFWPAFLRAVSGICREKSDMVTG